MAHPKRKTSKSRRDKRRTHYKAEKPTLTVCKETGAVHVPHKAYEVDGNLYYNGKLIVERAAAV
ncbi:MULTISPECIES: 50S ribosomal protein L32 [Sphingobacterium]|jgi:large subunit ribosomal protein L32|uniref:Large ribosomal subunit protein bL32 n=1 Tax=Sphingobacterium litopenaei TaxID=2763500 RepID=A0ABR7YGE6_9SPHI|nr:MULTISPECIES: 50S ribosomal protein L32 [Sphingobacterium]MBD1430391.1 50S ribosomal protein L32 [Sphingobacterium litopenaei]NGM73765.1 50S ribosomal protein L32 [Sphingobacterium sp. SGL-16]